MKAKKTYKAKIKANPGLKMNPWEVDQNPTVYNQYDAKFPYPVDYYPNIPGSSKNKIDAATGKPTYFQNRQDIVNPWNQDYSGGNQPDFSGAEIADGQPMDMSFKPYDPSNSGYGLPPSAGNSESSKGPSNGNKFGSMAQGFGKAAGQALNAITTGGPQLINALLPDQQLEREDRTIPRALNQYPQGINNSQAIYKNGGYIERTRRAGKKGRIQVTEEIPEYMPDNLQPIQSSQNIPFSFAPQQVPQPQAPQYRGISMNPIYDVNRQPTGYAAEYTGYGYNEAIQSFPQLPESYGGLPVVRNVEQYRDLYSGFMPNSSSQDWSPFVQEDYYPQPMNNQNFQFGGTMAYRSDGVAPSPNATKNYPFMPKYADGGEIESVEPIPLPHNEMLAMPEDRKRSSSYSGTFGEAFKQARKDLGSGSTFEWRGKKYTTNIAKEEVDKTTKGVRATTVKAATPKNQRVLGATDFINNVQGGVPADAQQYRNPVTPTMQQFNPAFNPNFDLGSPREEIVYGHNRPAPRGGQALAQNPQFNTFVENAGIATVPLDVLGLGAISKKLGKTAVKAITKNARNLTDDATRRMALQNVRNAENELAQYNLQGHKNANTYPINQWKKQPSQFEGSGNSPYTQFANEPTYSNYGSPMQQVQRMEGMQQSPFQRAFPMELQNQSPIQEMMNLDMEHAWSPLQRSGILPKKFKNGGFMEGDEVDLSPAEVRELIAQGYEIDIL